MKRAAWASLGKVVLVVVAGVASMATSAVRPRTPPGMTEVAGGHEVVAIVEVGDSQEDVEAREVRVTEEAYGSVVPSRSWVEPLGDGQFRRHVVVNAIPTMGQAMTVHVHYEGTWHAVRLQSQGASYVPVPGSYVTVPGPFAQPPPFRRYY